MKLKDKLSAKWSSREDDLEISFPLGRQTQCDAGWVAATLNKEVIAELDRRGYDKTTIRFSIEPKKGNERFASQRTTNPEKP